jgi:hypothetical protein
MDNTHFPHKVYILTISGFVRTLQSLIYEHNDDYDLIREVFECFNFVIFEDGQEKISHGLLFLPITQDLLLTDHKLLLHSVLYALYVMNRNDCFNDKLLFESGTFIALIKIIINPATNSKPLRLIFLLLFRRLGEFFTYTENDALVARHGQKNYSTIVTGHIVQLFTHMMGRDYENKQYYVDKGMKLIMHLKKLGKDLR